MPTTPPPAPSGTAVVSSCRVLYRPIPEFPDYYAGTDGSIVSAKLGRALKPTPNVRSGYLYVYLYGVDGKRKNCAVHTLIARTYLGPRPVGLQTLHADGDKANCALSNLGYGTPSQNVKDQVAHGTHACANKTECPQGHEYTPENVKLYQGRRYCRQCHRDNDRQRRSKVVQ